MILYIYRIAYRHRQRVARRIRLISNLPENNRAVPTPRPSTQPVPPTTNQPEPAAAVLHYGDYVLGDEDCLYLYGPNDLRY